MSIHSDNVSFVKLFLSKKDGKFRKKCFFKQKTLFKSKWTSTMRMFSHWLNWNRYWPAKIEEFYPTSALLDIKLKEQYHKTFNSRYFQKPIFFLIFFRNFSDICPFRSLSAAAARYWGKTDETYFFKWKTSKASWVCQKAVQARCCETVPFLQLHY